MDFSTLADVHLVVIYKAVKKRLIDVDRNVSWYERMIERDSDLKDYVKKLAIATAEYDALRDVLVEVAKELLLREYKTS